MTDSRQDPVQIQANNAYVGVTSDGDVIYQMAKPPPEGAGVPCPVKDCGASNWPHAKICHNCLKDYHEWRRVAFRLTVVALLILIVGVELASLLRN